MNTTQKQQQIPCLPPPCSHPEVTYAEEWKAANDLIGFTVYGLSWHKEYLVGCTSSGTISVWRIPFENKDNAEEFVHHHHHHDEEGKQQNLEAEKISKPIITFKASLPQKSDRKDCSEVLYSTKFLYLRQNIFLGVSGETGILLFLWEDILEEEDINPMNTDVSSFKNNISSIQPKHHFQPQVGRFEFNDFDYDDDYHIYGASDLGYKWNLDSGKLIAAYQEGRTKHNNNSYLHTIQALSSSTFPGGHSIVLMGGEDGTLGVWDHKCDKLIENIHIETKMNENSSILHSYSAGNKDSYTPWKQQSDLWISHLESSESSNWWNICGGASTKHNNSLAGGHLSCWHAQTRSLVSGCTTRETTNRIARNFSSGTIATIANESVISYWSATQLDRKQRCWTSSPCSYALAIRDDGLTAVGGIGTKIDILKESGIKVCSIIAAPIT